MPLFFNTQEKENKCLIVVDMQKEKVSRSPYHNKSEQKLPEMVNYLKNFKGDVFFTRDNHNKDYFQTLEGTKEPGIHCISETVGWMIEDCLLNARPKNVSYIDHQGVCFKQEELTFLKFAFYNEFILFGAELDREVLSLALLLRGSKPNTKISVIRNLSSTFSSNQVESATYDILKKAFIDII